MPEPANIPHLPPEVLVPIIAYSEETQCCLINLLSRGSLKCEEPHSFTTVIYTRGDCDQDGNYTRGANDNCNGSIKLEIDNGAYTNRLRPEDSQLAYERIRHLIIRPVFNYMDKIDAIILDELEGQLGEYHPAMNLSWPIGSNYYRAMDLMLSIDWHLLKNLEVLCLDLTGVDPHWRYPEIQASFVEMGRHLKLKTLILPGLLA
ncbi:uncharacterized protein FTOL_07480 [Fusarium torulosum]|uniref:Uncharacterized protein n=1 Tax=Fusarium torulosum TaxID=33205 RepID=A0AAE8SJ16_9HYPO|nr:uncharacterized protein FTOL_07480 [Fusarium torulosum]